MKGIEKIKKKNKKQNLARVACLGNTISWAGTKYAMALAS